MGPGVWKFNTSLLQDTDYHTLVTSFWQTYDHPDFVSQLNWWDQKKFYLREITRSFSKAKAVRERNRKTLLNKQLRELQRLFEAGDQAAFSKLCAVQQELHGIALNEGQVRARCQWAEEGGTSSSFVLNLTSKQHAKASKPSIRDPDTALIMIHLRSLVSSGLIVHLFLLHSCAILMLRMRCYINLLAVSVKLSVMTVKAALSSRSVSML